MSRFIRRGGSVADLVIALPIQLLSAHHKGHSPLIASAKLLANLGEVGEGVPLHVSLADEHRGHDREVGENERPFVDDSLSGELDEGHSGRRDAKDGG